jgi:hypothetical protein
MDIEQQGATPISTETVAYFDHKNDNAPKYRQLTFDQLVASLTHQVGEKGGEAISAGMFKGSRGSKNVIARLRILIDIESNPATGEVPPSPEEVAARIEARGWAGYIWTSYSHTTEMPRYHVELEIDAPHLFSEDIDQHAVDLEIDKYAMRLVVDRLKLTDVLDAGKIGPASIFYTARCPADRLAEARAIRIDGNPIRMQALIAKATELCAQEIADRRAHAEAAAAKAAARRASTPMPEGGTLIDKLRQAMPPLTEAMTSFGYRYYKAMDRWLHPASTTGVPGIMVDKGNDGFDRLVSFHGCDPLEVSQKAFGTGAHDVVDLVIAWRWGTSDDAVRAGLAELAREYGLAEEREGNTDDFDQEPDAWDSSKGRPPQDFGDAPTEATGAKTSAPIWNPWSEHAVPQFPLDVLPPDIASYVQARAIETGACLSAIAASVLTAASGAISHEARLYLKPGKNFPVGPRLWSAIIGPPSSKKSPVIEGAIKPLIKAQQQVQAGQWAAWKERQEEEGKKAPQKPELTKYTDNDMTPEAIVDVLSYQPRGMLLVADELSGFLTSFDRYGAGKGAAAGRAVWLQAYNGGYYAASRASRVVAPVSNLSVSILGGIQMDRLRELGNLTSDGLLQRFLPIWMRKPVLDSNAFDHAAWRTWRDRVDQLLAIQRFSVELTSDAQRERQRIAEFLFNLSQVESEGVAWQGFVGKMPGIWGSLALIMHCLWEPQVGTDLKLENAARASRLVEEFFLPHGLAFYREIAGGSQADNRNIAGFLAGWTGPTIKVRDFVRGPRCLRGITPDEIVKRLQPFEAGGWLLPDKAGPWNREWKVRPNLAARFERELKVYRDAIAAVQDRIRGFADDEG